MGLKFKVINCVNVYINNKCLQCENEKMFKDNESFFLLSWLKKNLALIFLLFIGVLRLLLCEFPFPLITEHTLSSNFK